MSWLIFSHPDHLTELLNTWKGNWFFRASLQKARLTRLQDVMTEDFTVHQITQIAVRIVRQLSYLHQRALAQKCLEIDDIYIRMDKSVRIFFFCCNIPTNHSHAKPRSVPKVHKRSFWFSSRGVKNAHLLQNLVNYFLLKIFMLNIKMLFCHI